eukprot:scaffold3547_cov110-Isochrysis_galbana.AAC.2
MGEGKGSVRTAGGQRSPAMSPLAYGAYADRTICICASRHTIEDIRHSYTRTGARTATAHSACALTDPLILITTTDAHMTYAHSHADAHLV